MSEQRQQLIEELKQLLAQDDVLSIKDEVERIKTQFYKPAQSEDNTSSEEASVDAVEAVTEEATEEVAAEAVEAAEPQVDEQETEFKELLAQYKSRRAEVASRQAAEMQANLARKQAILAEMQRLAEVEEADGVMANLQRMRELQAEWKAIGAVPAEKQSELRKDYQKYQEQFYDLVKINIELRDLDFKKNLELKTLICEAAERLMNNDNIVEASRALQQLHDEWAEIGPVARELREQLWERFKAASTAINKRHQAYFDELHAKEADNLARKQALLEQLKAINEEIRVKTEEGKIKSSDWDKASERVQAVQTEWRSIGFAPKKHNQAIYDAYRTECDAFFHAKTAYFRAIREVFSENLKRKRSLIEQAQAIVGSFAEPSEATVQAWNEATQRMRELQAEWKTIGAVTRKYSDELWKQFTEACDAFFNAKREASKEQREARRSRATGGKNIANAGGQALYRLRDNLMQEIKVAENNILFFTSKSKTANKLVDDMRKKIDKLKAQLEEVKAKIKAEEEAED